MFFQRKLMLWAFCLWLVGLMLGACGAPTPEEEGELTALPTTIPSATHTPPPVATDTPKPTPTNTPVPTLTNTPTPTPPSPEVIIDESNAVMKDLSGYHFESEMQITVQQGGIQAEIPISMSGDFENPDRSQMEINFEMLGFQFEMEMISIGDENYLTDLETSQWRLDYSSQCPSAVAGIGVEPLDAGRLGFIDVDEAEELHYEGRQELDGVDVYHFVGSTSLETLGLEIGGGAEVWDVEYWIGIQDNLSQKDGS